jgi:hypothetical protein
VAEERKGPHEGHVAANVEMGPSLAEWIRDRDIQYISEITDWNQGVPRERPMIDWLWTGKERAAKSQAKEILRETTEGGRVTHPLPFTRGHVI